MLKGENLTSARPPRGVIVLLGLTSTGIISLASLDLIIDVREGLSWRHGLLEGSLLCLGVLGLFYLGRAWQRQRSETRGLREEAMTLNARLEATAEEAARWQSEARGLIEGISQAIEAQMKRWGLTKAEREIASLLLKGLSHKEIAAVRGTSDSTTRQQARMIYRKAGLTGRNDLAAFFLEDLLTPAISPQPSPTKNFNEGLESDMTFRQR